MPLSWTSAGVFITHAKRTTFAFKLAKTVPARANLTPHGQARPGRFFTLTSCAIDVPETKNNNIFLVGLMGSGKTTIGRQLAKRLGKRFVDSDHEIEARTGASIPLIFDIEGEASFRRREADVIRDLSSQRGIVLATGGGAVLDAGTRARLAERGTV
jgi:hypothetical protein